MICKQCNNNVPNDSEYCPFCGNVVEKVIVETNPVSDVDKGYTYLELKEWEKAKEIFDFAIVNNDNKAKAYIGRLLAKLKLSDLVSLSSVNKKLTKFDDFKMAVKYADDNYKQQLKKYCSLVEEKINQKKAKSKKRIIISSISSISLIVLLVLTYFVFIPLGRFSYYQKLLTSGKVEKATKSYSDSKWFEFAKKTKELFYNNGVSLVENKDYKNAEFCFDTAKNFKDSKNYYTYCKAQNLLAQNDLESYNYFTKCKDFLDSKNILESNEYFILVNKLQGNWRQGDYVGEKSSYGGINWDLSKVTIGGIPYYDYIANNKISDDEFIEDMTITGINVYRSFSSEEDYKLVLIDRQIMVKNGKHFKEPITIENKTIKFLNYLWQKY